MATPRKKTARRSPPAEKKPERSARSRPQKAAESAAGGSSGGPRKSRSAGPASPDDMPPDVIEFITAVDDYKRIHGRPFPSWSEILEVLRGLGYRKAG